MPRSSKQPPTFKILLDTCYMPNPYHPWFDNIWLGVQIMKFFIIQFSPPSCSCLLPGLQHIPQYPFSNTLVPCSSRNYSARESI
jgi:hypothetical protein